MQGERSKCVRGRKVMSKAEKSREDRPRWRIEEEKKRVKVRKVAPVTLEYIDMMGKLKGDYDERYRVRKPGKCYVALRGAWSIDGYTPWRDQKVS